MRRIIIFVITILVVSSALPARTITITEPGAGWGWTIGETRHIRWNGPTNMNPFVKIHLVRSENMSLVLEIRGNTPNDGDFTWTLPRSLSAGEYKIKILSTDNSVLAVSYNFEIMGTPPTPVTITSPRGNRTYETRVNIIWEGNQPYLDAVKFELYNEAGTAKVADIITNLPRQDIHGGQYFWERPMSVRKGNYRIKLSALSGPFFVLSPVFKLGPYPAPYITFQSPKAGMAFSPGGVLNIKWKKYGNHRLINKVRIEIYSKTTLGKSVKIIDPAAKNNGSYSWRIPTMFPTGIYMIKISSSIMFRKELGISDEFTIKKPGKLREK